MLSKSKLIFDCTCLVIGSLVWISPLASTVAGQDVKTKKLTVGIRHVPPFVIKNSDGTFEGISIVLWENVAKQLDLEYKYREFSLTGLLNAVEKGQVDLVVGALTVTANREDKMDFTHPFLSSGLGVAVRKTRSINWIVSLYRDVLAPLLGLISTVAILTVIAGVLIWGVEHKSNPDHFGGGTLVGIGNGIWWAAVTMTTVGYGDKAPKTLSGRIIALFWMYSGIVAISLFTAAVASQLTLSSFETSVRHVRDLNHVRTGAVQNSSGREYLAANGIPYSEFADVQDMLQALEKGQLDAVVYDRPILRYLVARELEDLRVLHLQIEKEDYAFALPIGSPLRKPINKSLLKHTRTQIWKSTIVQYLGE